MSSPEKRGGKDIIPTIDTREALPVVMSLLEKGSTYLLNPNTRNNLQVIPKANGDYATQADYIVQAMLINTLMRKYPQSRFLSEEMIDGGVTDFSVYKQLPYVWVIDPLDGTHNYAEGGDYFAVSVALVKKGKVVLGGVTLPAFGETYWAHEGQEGAYCNGEQLGPKFGNNLKGAFIASYFDTPENFGAYSPMPSWYKKLKPHIQEFDSKRNAVVDLVHLARGWVQGVVQPGSYPWDHAAGSYIAQKRGAVVRNLDGRYDPFKRSIIGAETPELYQAMRSKVRAPKRHFVAC